MKRICALFVFVSLWFTSVSQEFNQIIYDVKELNFPANFEFSFLKDLERDSLYKIDTNTCWKYFGSNGKPLYQFENLESYDTYIAGKLTFENGIGLLLIVDIRSNQMLKVYRSMDLLLFDSSLKNFSKKQICLYQEIEGGGGSN